MPNKLSSQRDITLTSGFRKSLKTLLPKTRFAHNADYVDFERLQGKICLIVGGRQGAFEWVGLLSDYAQHVDIVYRHDTPRLTPSDWSWVYPYIDKTRQDPGWFRRRKKMHLMEDAGSKDALNWKTGYWKNATGTMWRPGRIPR